MLSFDTVSQYPAYDKTQIEAALRAELASNKMKFVVLDDDPTGVQTVHDIYVYTHWDEESIRDGFLAEEPLFYILTNSRGMTREETVRAHEEIAAVCDKVSKETGVDYCFISRSDSTLRGHYPLETEVLRREYEKNTGRRIDGEVLCFFFKEGGRYTIGDVHYVRYGDTLVPANETEVAGDRTFGYSAPSMPAYVEEKTEGAYKAETVTCISLEELRGLDYDGIEAKLLAVHDFNKVVVNAVSNDDVTVFCTALMRAIKQGKMFAFRTAAAFVKVIADNPDRPLLTREEMVCSAEEVQPCIAGEASGEGKVVAGNRLETGRVQHGGVIVIGSHTAKTTAQLEKLRTREDIVFTELDISLVRDEEAFEAEVARCLALEEKEIAAGHTVCCYTSRTLMTADTGNKEDDLRLSVRISDAVQSLVGRLTVTPSFVIAKGGITSSDVGVKALGVRKALVLGAIRPGIPVWRTDEGSRFPGVPYVIFPGNVGEDVTLLEAAEILMLR